MCFCAFGMGADGVLSLDVVVNAESFPIWTADGVVVSGLCPCWLAISEFCCGDTITIMLADGVVQFTTEDAADWVMWSAAMEKGLVVRRRLATMG